jgi:DNA topoisomerase-1
MFGGGKPQWTVLQHNGPMFPPEYKPHKIPVIINSKEVILPEQAEEYATMFAKFIDTPYIENNTFKKNFWKDFKQTLGDIKVNTLDEIDFSLIKKYLENEKEKRLNISKEEKEKKKEIEKKEDEPYMYCIIDGNQQKVGNFKIEPPGIFLGRGTHPKIGRIKKRIYPEDVILNLDKDAPIPKTIDNHKWSEIIHDQSVIWLATWKDGITGKNKYIFTSFESFFKSKSDEEKFNLAKKLKKKINEIRKDYESQLTNNDDKQKQLATALYFIEGR